MGSAESAQLLDEFPEDPEVQSAQNRLDKVQFEGRLLRLEKMAILERMNNNKLKDEVEQLRKREAQQAQQQAQRPVKQTG
jgi:hypothetical protein